MGARSPDTPPASTPRSGKKPPPRDANVRVKVGTAAPRKGVAVLGDEELRFHTGRTGRDGKDFYLHLRYDRITSLVVDPHAGTLVVSTPEHEAITFHLGRYAADWKRLIEERPSRLDELEVTPRSRIAMVAIDDDDLVTELSTRVRGFEEGPGEVDLLFVGVRHRADLPRLAELARRLRRPRGVLWLVYAVESRVLPESEIIAAARAAGLSAGRTVALSRTHAALRLIRA
jgi:hypothetical protein